MQTPEQAIAVASTDTGAGQDDERSSGLAAMLSEPDYNAHDYLMLPSNGDRYYSLEDAALLAALDHWGLDRYTEFPLGGRDPVYDAGDPEVRKRVKPLQQQILAAMVRSVEAGQLEAEVRARNMSDSRIVPGRTYVLIGDLMDWLEIHGHGRGDLLLSHDQDPDVDPWDLATHVAEQRAAFRHPLPEAAEPAAPASFDEVEALRRELRARMLQIVDLQQRASPSEKPLSTRERNVLLIIIGALCKEAKIEISKPTKAAALIADLAEQVGQSVGETTIREHLKKVGEALGTRAK